MIRIFCDVCDERIETDDRVFRVEVTEGLRRYPVTDYGKDIRLADNHWLSPTMHRAQVCISCITSILSAIVTVKPTE